MGVVVQSGNLSATLSSEEKMFQVFQTHFFSVKVGFQIFFRDPQHIQFPIFGASLVCTHIEL